MTQDLVLFAISTGSTLKFGKMVFQTVLQFAECGSKATKFPYPSLIFEILASQGLFQDNDEELYAECDQLKIAQGNRIVDLPWFEACTTLDVGNMGAWSSGSKPAATTSSDFVMMSTSFVQYQINFGLQHIKYDKERLQYYAAQLEHFEAHVTDYKILLDVGVHSGQTEGVGAAEAAAKMDESDGDRAEKGD